MGAVVKQGRAQGTEQVTIAGVVMFVAGLLWTGRYTMRALAMPDTYDGALVIGGSVTLVGVVLTLIGVLGWLRGR
ncbi:hypothetical protein GCM10009839_29410 [Catenulispora yoronensis]|uniref:DUF202 domain-containing protein n=1 Tax=Catenulispora yoronensis TaxID=450799 RepID=A0ABN2U455_9ACTN